MHRRDVLRLALASAALALPGLTATAAGGERVVVAKSPTCGCCAAWVEHMQAAGFEVEVQDVAQAALDDLKRRIGLTPEQASCHTAAVGGYFVEGHVPAEDVKRLLAERPEIRGLAVPGMPVGSPGMEMGGRRDPYQVLAIAADGRASVFAEHG